MAPGTGLASPQPKSELGRLPAQPASRLGPRGATPVPRTRRLVTDDGGSLEGILCRFPARACRMVESGPAPAACPSPCSLSAADLLRRARVAGLNFLGGPASWLPVHGANGSAPTVEVYRMRILLTFLFALAFSLPALARADVGCVAGDAAGI